MAWGLFHGLFLVIERMGFGSILLRLPRLIRHSYALLVVLVGWVLFRADSFEQAAQVLGKMAGLGSVSDAALFREFVSPEVALFAVLAAICSTPAVAMLRSGGMSEKSEAEPSLAWLSAHIGVFFIALGYLADSRFNPFIYFRF